MPVKALSSPSASNLLPDGTAAQVTSDDATNFTIRLSGFRCGCIHGAIQAGMNTLVTPNTQPPVGCEVVVELEFYPGDWVIVALFDPEQMATPGGGNSQPGTVWALRGPGKSGWARAASARRVRFRRVDVLGSSINVAGDFREGDL